MSALSTNHNPSRREELLEAVADYLLANGVSDLSLRPLAASIGTHARLLIYHFGSREQLIDAALSLILRRVQNAFLAMQAETTLESALPAFWRWATETSGLPYLRLVFEVHGLAPYQPEVYGGYVRQAFDSWTVLIAERLRARQTARQKEAIATLIVAAVDGLLMDFLATGDHERTTRALRLFIKQLATMKGAAQ